MAKIQVTIDLYEETIREESGLDNLDEEKLLEMLSFANGAASLITTRKGALKVMPEVDEVKKLIQ